MANLTIAVTAGAAASVQYRLNGKDLGNASLRLSSYNAAVEAENTYKIEHTTSDTIMVTTLSGGPVRMDYISYAYERPKPQPRLATDPFPVPEYVYAITNQDHHADPQADLVIIIPTSQKLRPQAERLAQMHRDRDSMRVNIVPADELYNEFSSGTPDANAYRRYLKMLYDRAGDDEAQMPKHLLLFGDAVWDCRMLTPECRSLNADDYLLAHESENSFSETDCYVNDGWMTLLDEGEGGASIRNDKEDVAVGRIPVTTTAEAKAVVDKIIAYANNAHAGDWANTIMFMGDDGNNNLHMRDVDATAEYIGQLYPGYQIKKVMWDAYTRVSTSTGNRYPEVSRLLKQQQQAAPLLWTMRATVWSIRSPTSQYLPSATSARLPIRTCRFGSRPLVMSCLSTRARRRSARPPCSTPRVDPWPSGARRARSMPITISLSTMPFCAMC